MKKSAEVYLIPFTSDHARLTFKWASDPNIRHAFLMRGEVTWEGHQAYFRHVLADPSQRVFAIMAEGSHIGNCGLKNLDISKKEGELWIYIGDLSTRRMGVGQRATELLIGEGYEQLGLDRIYLHVADFNLAARKMYQKLGFLEVPLQEDSSDWSNRECKIIRMELKKFE